MKVICDCSNQAMFNTINEDTGEENPIREDEGQYATIGVEKFRFWQAHDIVGIVCEKCDKSIWMFT